MYVRELLVLSVWHTIWTIEKRSKKLDTFLNRTSDYINGIGKPHYPVPTKIAATIIGVWGVQIVEYVPDHLFGCRAVAEYPAE